MKELTEFIIATPIISVPVAVVLAALIVVYLRSRQAKIADQAFQARHEQANHDMPGYTDYRRVHGREAADRVFPHIIPHLRECADCKELHDELMDLVNMPDDNPPPF